MSNVLNTPYINSVVGFTLDDITTVQPFRTVFSTAWFAVFVVFIATILIMMAIALIYSFCECFVGCCKCCCSCCCPKNKVSSTKSADLELEDMN